MSDGRRYDDEEVAEILERATASEAGHAPVSSRGAEGLTLAQLQEIGSEVGIPPARIADAARALASRGLAQASRAFLGVPRAVSRVVPIDRALDDDEWTHLVVDLRETFGAEGRVRVQGALRSWSNGNLQVHVEPSGEGYRVRLRTFKGDVVPIAMLGGAVVVLGVIQLLHVVVGDAGRWGLVGAALIGLFGLGLVGSVRVTLKRWAAARRAQMEGLAERIGLLLKD